MDTQTETPAESRPVIRFPWLPRSGPAAGVFLLTAALVVGPVLWIAFVTLVTYTGCFLECTKPNHLAGLGLGVLDLGLVALPFLAVRLFQAARPATRGLVWALALILLGGALCSMPVAGLQWWSWF
jgi:hypothetical protein